MPPSEVDCPRCAKMAAPPPPPVVQAPAPVAATPQPPAPPQGYAPPRTYAPPQAYAPTQSYTPPPVTQPPPPPPPPVQAGPVAPPPPEAPSRVQGWETPAPHYAAPANLPPIKEGMPAWIVVALVALVLIAAMWAGIRLMDKPQSLAATSAIPTPEPAKGKGSSPFAKHIEVSGLRVTENAKKKLEVHMVVVNHSAADLPDLNLNVVLRVANAASGSDPITEFTVKLPALAGFEARDIKAEAATKLRAYEFPDWQFLKPEFEVLSQ